MMGRMMRVVLAGLLLAGPVAAADRLRANLRGVVIAGQMEGDFYSASGDPLFVPLAGVPIRIQVSIRPNRGFDPDSSDPADQSELIGLVRITLNNGNLLAPGVRFADQLRGGFNGLVPLGFCCLPGETAMGATSLTSTALPAALRHDVQLSAYSDSRNVGHAFNLQLLDGGSLGGSGRFAESYRHSETWISGFDFAITSGSVSAAIPEPSAWLGMIAGMGLTGLRLRGHRRLARG